VTVNADWTPVERDVDGVMMVFVPSGCFLMGADNGEIDQKPVAQTCISAPFWLDKTEVTQAQFVAHHGEKALANNFTGDNRPVERVSWFEANAYCQARGARLPSEAEWEFAARGLDSLIFPWGDTFAAGNVVLRETSGGHTADVGSRPTGASWVGALDMVGNVWEWTASLYAPYPFNTDGSLERDTGDSTTVQRVLRVGGWRCACPRRVSQWGQPDPDGRRGRFPVRFVIKNKSHVHNECFL